VYNPNPSEPNVNSENHLKFWLANNDFKGKPITIQQVSSDPNVYLLDPNFAYPVWDIRQIISKNNRKLPLDNLVNQKPNIDYSSWELSSTKQLADINGDGKVNKKDHDAFVKDYGKTGPSRSDLVGPKGPGLPNGVVDNEDGNYLMTEINRLDPNGPYPNPYGFSDGFETGNLGSAWTTSGNKPWSVVSTNGDHYAQSGAIGNSQNSILELTANAQTGKIKFQRKVSSEDGWDYLKFYIDGVEKGRWSGEQDWQPLEYTTTPGTHLLKWGYDKDSSVSSGEDAAWIDNVNVQ
jgi:hypothetical protein